MELINYSHSILSIVPPIVALGLAIITRRVLLSLGIGILLGAFLLNDYSIAQTCSYIYHIVRNLFIDGDSINSWNMSIIAFLILLGMITSLLTLSGGTIAFATWAQTKIKTQRGAKLLTAFLGIFIFVDDYFNSLAVGTIARPVTDEFKVSRAKLAYLLDSTAAPMCVIMPASSWGAYIITIIAGILTAHGINQYTPIGAFMLIVPMNFYAIFTLLMVLAVAWFKINIGPMRACEKNAAQGHDLSANNKISLKNIEADIRQSNKGRLSDLIVPILVLIFATIFFMIYTGNQSLQADGKMFSILGAFENTDVGMSLCYGGLTGLIAALIPNLIHKASGAQIVKTLSIGAKSMFSAILILFFAWSIGSVIGDMKTGAYLSTLVQGNIPTWLLPAILFLLSFIMAFATGTSWGTFGIMLPIAGDLAAATEVALMLPVLAAVLAGSVCGDHCSPISDTTILSSTGAHCNHMDHVSTQLPYALTIAGVSTFGYLVLGFTDSLMISFAATFVVFAILVALLKQSADQKVTN